MAQQNRTTLKSYFEAGDRPRAAEFIDLIDSALNLNEDGITLNTTDINANNHSLDISQHLHVESKDLQVNNGTITVADTIGGATNVTISNTSGISMTGGSFTTSATTPVTMSGGLALTGGTLTTSATTSVTMSGGLTMAGGSLITTASTLVTMNGGLSVTGGSLSTGPNIPVTLNGGLNMVDGNLTVSPTTPVNIYGALTMAAGTFNMIDSTLVTNANTSVTMNGGLTIDGGTLTTSAATTTTMNGSLAVNGSALTTSATTPVTLNGGLTVSGDLTLQGNLHIVRGTHNGTYHVNTLSTTPEGDLVVHMNSSGLVLPNLLGNLSNIYAARFVTRHGVNDVTTNLSSGTLHVLHAPHHHNTVDTGGVIPSQMQPLADYAEYFESEDGKAIGVATAVAMGEDGKIHPAKEGETPIGVISGIPLIAGNNPLEWPGKYLRDAFGQIIMETYETYEDDDVPEVLKQQTDGEEEVETANKGKKITKQRPKCSPEYDPDKEYVLRSDREEWCCVGLLGQLPLRKGQPVAPGWVKLREISAKADVWLVK